MKKLNSIHLGLENCEVFEFKAEDINYISLIDISKAIVYSSDYLTEYNNCEELILELKPSANVLESNITGIDNDELPFKRIASWRDIVLVECFYDDGTSVTVYVPYYSKRNYEMNEYQSTELIDNGNLRIAVSKKVKADQ